MSPELTKEINTSIIFSGVCNHCGNSTLLHVLEIDIQTCAFCHQVDPNSDSVGGFEHGQEKFNQERVSTANNN